MKLDELTLDRIFNISQKEMGQKLGDGDPDGAVYYAMLARDAASKAISESVRSLHGNLSWEERLLRMNELLQPMYLANRRIKDNREPF